MRRDALSATRPAEDDLGCRDQEQPASHPSLRDKGAVSGGRSSALDKTVADIRDSLTEQIRLLAAAPDFGNKVLVTNCAHVALMLVRQLSLRYGGHDRP